MPPPHDAEHSAHASCHSQVIPSLHVWLVGFLRVHFVCEAEVAVPLYSHDTDFAISIPWQGLLQETSLKFAFHWYSTMSRQSFPVVQNFDFTHFVVVPHWHEPPSGCSLDFGHS